jgi:hypothetical protein
VNSRALLLVSENMVAAKVAVIFDEWEVDSNKAKQPTVGFDTYHSRGTVNEIKEGK